MNISTKKTVFLILLFTFWIFPIPRIFSNSFKENTALSGTNIKLSSSEEDSLQEDKYIIGPGDTLGLEILDLPELSGEINVLNDGTSSIPIIGSVYLKNLTLRGATEKIRSLLSKELIRPDLRISVLKARPLRISIVGEVERPGLYTLDSNQSSEDTQNPQNHTLIDAIIKSGGITTRANLKEVILKRRLPGNDMNYKLAKLDLFSLIREGNQSQNPLLFDGDVILLKEVKEKDKGSFDKTLGNLYPEEIDVYIIGDNQPRTKYYIGKLHIKPGYFIGRRDKVFKSKYF